MNADAFWTHVDKSGDCWLWTAGTNGNGRGRLTFNGRAQYAYRVAWELTHGEPIPAQVIACHRCDNPLCVRPDHLFLGSQLDNMGDAVAKGRTRNATRSGMDHHYATRTPEQIAAAVAEYRSGSERQADVAARYGVSQSTLSNWCSGRTRLDGGVEPGWRLAPHGTHAGYVRHRRAGEAACDECLAGERAHGAAQRVKRLSRVRGVAS